jgi:hypothetical protein
LRERARKDRGRADIASTRPRYVSALVTASWAT